MRDNRHDILSNQISSRFYILNDNDDEEVLLSDCVEETDTVIKTFLTK